jgi:hypothetical protein
LKPLNESSFTFMLISLSAFWMSLIIKIVLDWSLD